MHPVKQRVRGLVSNDVVREAREDHAPGHVIGRIFGIGVEVAEQKRDLVGRVIRILLAKRVRVHPEAADEQRVVPIIRG